MIGTFIRRPVFTTMFVLMLVVFGIRCYPNIGVDLTPDVDLPLVSVRVTYDGASPQEMETLITKPIENSVSQVAGIKTLSSTVLEGYSETVLEFEFDYTEEISVSLNEKLNFEGWVKFNGMEFSDAEISYESSDDTVGAVSADGVFSPLKEGTTVVTVKAQWRNIQSELLTRIFTITVI